MRTIQTFWWRHGETDWNLERRWQGHTDIPLNHTGLHQAKQLASTLAKIPLQSILSSDLSRAMKTAAVVAREHSIPIVPCAELREAHYGQAEGLQAEQIRRKFGIKLLEDWRSPGNWDSRFLGGESKNEIVQRVLTAVEQYIEQQDIEHIGISTHGGVLRKVLNKIDSNLALPSPIPNCAVFKIEYERDTRKWRLVP